MTRRCELTGKLPMSGQLRSHAENKTKRTFRPNLCQVTLISDTLQRKVRLLRSVQIRFGRQGHRGRACGRSLAIRDDRKRQRRVNALTSMNARLVYHPALSA